MTVETVHAVRFASPEEVETKPVDTGDGNTYTNAFFIGSYEATTGHTVQLAEILNPGGAIDPHFHGEHQFQLVKSGSGRIGDVALAPGSLHYADAYTPYGPLVAGSDGISWFTIRVNPNKVNEFRVDTTNVAAYKRAGVTHDLDLAQPQDMTVLGPFPDGLSADRKTFQPSDRVELDAPEGTGGQAAVVLSGTLTAEGESYPQWSWVSVPAGETASGDAGETGLDLLVLQFPARPPKVR